MLAITSVPEYLDTMYSEYKKIAEEIYQQIKDAGEEKKIPGQTDLLKTFPEGTVIYILNGFFRFKNSEKLMRLYSQNDFLVMNDFYSEASLSSDFGTHIAVFDIDEFQNILQKNKAILGKWLQLQSLENNINRLLATIYMEDNQITPDFNLKEYKSGDVIAKEGDEPYEIFEMISGEAVAIHEGKEIGVINEGEIFGEISFLTESTRTATVKATESCIVSTMKKEQFWDIVKYNPQLILSISKTLAKRIVALNDVITGKTT